MGELVGVYYRIRDEQRSWLNEQPEGASEALRAILEDVMAKGTRTGTLTTERRVIIAGDNLSFSEFVQFHILIRKGDNRLSYIRSPAVRDYLVGFGRTYTELQAEIERLEGVLAPPSPPPTPDGGWWVEKHDQRQGSKPERGGQAARGLG